MHQIRGAQHPKDWSGCSSGGEVPWCLLCSIDELVMDGRAGRAGCWVWPWVRQRGRAQAAPAASEQKSDKSRIFRTRRRRSAGPSLSRHRPADRRIRGPPPPRSGSASRTTRRPASHRIRACQLHPAWTDPPGPPPPSSAPTVPMATAASARAGPASDELFKIVTNVNQVLVPVQVKDDSGRLVNGLLSRDFVGLRGREETDPEFLHHRPVRAVGGGDSRSWACRTWRYRK